MIPCFHAEKSQFCIGFRFSMQEVEVLMSLSPFLLGKEKLRPATAICKTEITNAVQAFRFFCAENEKVDQLFVFPVRKCEIPSSNRDLQDGNHKCCPAFRFSGKKVGKAPLLAG